MRPYRLIFLSIFVLTGSCYHIPEESKKALLQLHDKCMEETKASIPHLQKCIDRHIPEDADAKCYLHCMISQSTVDLEGRFAMIDGVKHELSQDVHDWKTHVNRECDMKIGKNKVFGEGSSIGTTLMTLGIVKLRTTP